MIIIHGDDRAATAGRRCAGPRSQGYAGDGGDRRTPDWKEHARPGSRTGGRAAIFHARRSRNVKRESRSLSASGHGATWVAGDAKTVKLFTLSNRLKVARGLTLPPSPFP